MKAEYHKKFDKQFAKLPKSKRDKVIEAVDLFIDNPLDSKLRNHALTGEWAGFRSISVGGDLRLHLEMIDDQTAFFVAVGTHSQLYR